MIFIIKGMKYDTEKMELIANVVKWYSFDNALLEALYGREVGRNYYCKIWKSKKGNWILTHELDGKTVGEVIEEDEAKELLMRYAPIEYEKIYGEIQEA